MTWVRSVAKFERSKPINYSIGFFHIFFFILEKILFSENFPSVLIAKYNGVPALQTMKSKDIIVQSVLILRDEWWDINTDPNKRPIDRNAHILATTAVIMINSTTTSNTKYILDVYDLIKKIIRFVFSLHSLMFNNFYD